MRAVVLAESSADLRAYPETLRVRGQGGRTWKIAYSAANVRNTFPRHDLGLPVLQKDSSKGSHPRLLPDSTSLTPYPLS